MKGNCKDCKYYRDGVCTVPMWKDAALYTEHETQPEAGCELFEEEAENGYRN